MVSEGEVLAMRLRIGSGFGIPVYIHWTFLFLPLLILMRPADSDVPLALSLTILPLLFTCVVLHEFGHALMARRFGIDTQDVTLYPIGGVARLLSMTEKPLEEFLIAVAGPAVNGVITLVFLGVLVPLAFFNPHWVFGTFAGHVAWWVMVGNIVMIAFNMLPAFPMDGGRVLRALLTCFVGHYQATQIAVGIGMLMAVFIGVAGMMLLQGAIMLPVVMAFVFFAGMQELAAVRARQRRRAWEDEEPLEVLPVRPRNPLVSLGPPPLPALMFQPKISVYTWDNQTGTWRKDSP
jgi:Zn-dependent protease